MKTAYIGLSNSPHDPAIAIVDQSGEIIFAEAAERLLQNKRAWGCPPDDLLRLPQLLNKYLSDYTELCLATTWTRVFIKEFQYRAFDDDVRFKNENNLFKHYFFRLLSSNMNINTGWNTIFQGVKLCSNLKIRTKNFFHHLTHAAAGCFTSSFTDAICLIIDGYGENTSIALYEYNNGKLKHLQPGLISDGSLGEFYSIVTYLCGFDPLKGEEWKVMGLAPYGQLDKKYYSILKSLIKVDGCKLVNNCNKELKISELTKLVPIHVHDPIEYANLAFTGQYVYTELLTELLNNIYLLGVSKNIILGGGCALNSSYNGILLEQTSFKDLYVFSAPADDGNAVGAALLAYYQDHPDMKPHRKWQQPYLGEKLCQETLNRYLKNNLLEVTILSEEDLCKLTAKLLADGKIIGWLQGSAEFGPRSLGNRSILADPRSPDVKKRLNNFVKFREGYRPFAPSILHEFGDEYFINYQESPYMERTLKFRTEVLDKVPGVVHVDGTGRLQTVKREWNSRFYRLIKEFYILTDIPLLLNTSFNIMGKPISHSVEDALGLFLTTGLDVLVMENYICQKSNSAIKNSSIAGLEALVY